MDEVIGNAIEAQVFERELAAIGAPKEGTLHGAGIAAVGSAIPEHVVSNEEIAARLSVSPDWIQERTGVQSRRRAGPNEGLPDFAAAAGLKALGRAGLEPLEVDLVLVATMSHDYLTPNAAPLVAEAMGCARAGAMDVGAACTGFVSALALATAQIEAGRCTTALVVGVDFLSRLTDTDDRSTAALFGDGAAAVVVSRVSGKSRIGPAIFGSDGAKADLVESRRDEGMIRMKGPDTYRQAVDRLSEVAEQAAQAAGTELGQIDLFAFHQANGRILDAVGERLDLAPERVINAINGLGNTSAASIPLALAQADAAGTLNEGSTVLLAAFGGGLTWGAAVVEWGVSDAP